jgi:3'-phosphoadenosine 5'-phosphosulfate sulfotransferase (PAPS reductase)/FAD synthetase
MINNTNFNETAKPLPFAKPLLGDVLAVGVSGGRTSGFMALYIWLIYTKKKLYREIVFYFCNTGEEAEETLIFVKNITDIWGIPVVWLEPIFHEHGVGTTHKIVDFETAKRKGEPFDEMLKKYPIPNKSAPNCTRELKERLRESLMRTLGFDKHYTALGIRADEMHRISNTAEQRFIIYPLAQELQVDEIFIRNWFEKQAFDLGLLDYQGNCNLCFKKSMEKQITLMIEHIENGREEIIFRWINREEKYSTEISPRFDLRDNLTYRDKYEIALKVIAGTKKHKKTKDKHEVRKLQTQLILDEGLSKGIPKELMNLKFDCFCKAS